MLQTRLSEQPQIRIRQRFLLLSLVFLSKLFSHLFPNYLILLSLLLSLDSFFLRFPLLLLSFNVVLSQVVDGPPEEPEVREEAKDDFELVGWRLEDAFHYEVFYYGLVEIDALPLGIEVEEVDGGLGFAVFLEGHLVELLGLEEVDFDGGVGGGAAVAKV